MHIKPVSRRSLPLDTVALARYLIGKYLVRDLPAGRMCGRIVETEAYPVGDSTGYAYPGLTEHNAPLFAERGHAHVRLLYGTAWTLNVSSEARGFGAAVLIRAVEPVEGVNLMQRRRRGARLTDIARGPGRLAAAMRIDRRLDGIDLTRGRVLWLGSAGGRSACVGTTRRIGLSREQHRPLRFYQQDNAYVSGPKKALRNRKSRKRAAPRTSVSGRAKVDQRPKLYLRSTP